MKAHNISNLPIKKKIRERIEPIGGIVCGQKGFVLDVEVSIIFLLLLLSLVKSKWWMNSDLSERNRVAFCQKQRGVIFFLRVPGSPLLFLFLSRCLHCLSLFLFHSPCIHRLSLDFRTSLYFYLCVLFNFNRWFFVIYNERIFNGVVVLTNNVIYRFLTYSGWILDGHFSYMAAHP